MPLKIMLELSMNWKILEEESLIIYSSTFLSQLFSENCLC